MSTAGETRHVFVVRVWREPNAAEAGQWRGSVEHAVTGHRLYFASLDELTDFIALRLGGTGMARRQGTGPGGGSQV